ncbi:MAG: 50S ribosomal protein L10 [Candidatus Aenigmatarchaeota archaeon]
MAEKKGRLEPRMEKIEKVEKLRKLIAESPVVGMISIFKMPASPLQNIRYALKDSARILVTKKDKIMKALEKVDDKRALLDHMAMQPALILSDMNPFKLYKIIERSKSKVPAKPGDVATEEIVVPAGPTDLPPGPAISSLTKVKIAAKVEAGKIAIMRDSLVAKPGDVISADLASALNMLKIKPMEIGLDVVAIWEDGTVYKKDVLAVDEEKIVSDMALAASQAFNLSMNAGWVTKRTIEPLIIKAFMEAKTLGIEAGIIDKGVIEELLAKAKRQAEALKQKVGE